MDIEALEKMLAGGADNAMLRFTLGKACFDLEQYAKAVMHLDEAVRQDAQYSAAWKWLGRALERAGELERAAETFRKGIEAARQKGDRQAEKEMAVFLRRVEKQQGKTQ